MPIDREAMDATACRKCGRAMRPHNQGPAFKCTGYLCACGHWNDLKRRKPKAPVSADALEKEQTK